MYMYSTIAVFLVILVSAHCAAESTDDICKSEKVNGTCIKVISCPYVLRLIANKDLEKIKNLKCGFEGSHPMVCCPKDEVPIIYNNNEETATNRPKPSTLKSELTTRYVPNTIEQTDKIFPDKSICGVYNGVSDRIVGGTITQLDEHPWLALIRYIIDNEDVFGCSAVLITDRFVLTAAHCTIKIIPVSVRLGEWNINTEKDCYKDICHNNTVNVNISSIIRHPTFSRASRSVSGDIALIQLDQVVTFTEFIRPICLPVSKYIELQDYSSDSVYLTAGWGETEFETGSVVKRQVEINAAPIEACKNIYNFKAETESTIICAGGTKGKDTCRGDSGGPLIKLVPENYEVNWYLFGITSYGTSSCGAEGRPGMYTRVSAYMDWIREVVSNGS